MGTLFALLFGRAFDKMGKKANICPKLTKNAYFGPILAVFGPKILIFMGVSKSFGTNITENHLDNLSALFFGQALDQMGQKYRYFAQNASFGTNLAIFGPKILIFMGVSKSFGTNITENYLDNLSALFFGQAVDQMGKKCRYLAKNSSFGPN